MDIEHIQSLIKELEINDPAFENTRFAISELPRMDGKWLGCYYPDQNLIVVTPHANEAVILHEMGHRHSDFYYHDLSEKAAESFRKVYQGNYHPYQSSSALAYILGAALGAIIGWKTGKLV